MMLKKLAPTKISYTYKENVVLAIVSGRLMNAVTWDEVPIIVSCTIISHQKAECIVIMREMANAKCVRARKSQDNEGSQEKNELVQETSLSSVDRVKSASNSEVMRNIDQCLLQQKQMSKLVTDLSEQFRTQCGRSRLFKP